jgi:CubicO group peptidase (beta-lactamase class C family)
MALPLIENGLAPGLVIGIQLGDEAWIGGFGKLAPGSETAPGADTLFEIGSISKVFTGILLADAIERQICSLDDVVTERMEASTGEPFVMPDFEDEPIRLWHLTTHTSALPRLPTNFRPKDPANPYTDYSFEDLDEFLRSYELRRPPGIKYAYSNLAVGLLGNLLATLQDTNYADLLAERITGPLGLPSTSCTLDADQRTRLAPGYDMDGEPQPMWDVPVFLGAGGIRSTMTDMLHFARLNLHPEKSPMEAALRRAQVILHKDASGIEMALGWHAGAHGALRWHTGQTGGYHSYISIWPAGDVAVVLLANTSSGLVDLVAESTLRILMGGEPLPIEVRPSIELPLEDLEPLVGDYRVGFFKKMTITLERGRLFAQMSLQPRLRLHATAKDHFHYRVVAADVYFVRDEEGNVTGLEIHQGGAITKGKRAE